MDRIHCLTFGRRCKTVIPKVLHLQILSLVEQHMKRCTVVPCPKILGAAAEEKNSSGDSKPHTSAKQIYIDEQRIAGGKQYE